MTDADLQLSQLFRTAPEPAANPAFAEQVMAQVAVERRKVFVMRLALQGAAVCVIAALAMATPGILSAFIGADLSGFGQASMMVLCVLAATAALGRPLLVRLRG